MTERRAYTPDNDTPMRLDEAATFVNRLEAEMGWNTVAVLYNDMTGDMPWRMADAIVRSYGNTNTRDKMAANFGFGMVISQEHADTSQVVIVGRNSGVRASDADGLDWIAIEQMRQCLERHGYKVTKRRRKPSLPTPQEPRDEHSHNN